MNVNNVLMNGTAARGHSAPAWLWKGFWRHRFLSPGCPVETWRWGRTRMANSSGEFGIQPCKMPHTLT